MTQAARTGNIPLEELAALPVATGFVPSWAGDKVAFYWNKTGRFEIHSLDLISGETRQLTDGQLPATPRGGFVWTRDDAAIIFVRDNKGDEQNNLYRLDVKTGLVTQLNDDPRTQEYAGEVHPDNSLLAVASNRAGQVNVFTLGPLNETCEWRQITHFESPANPGRWSPDGRWLIMHSNESANLKNLDGYLISTDGSQPRRVLALADGSVDTIRDWHPDGRNLSITSDVSGAFRSGTLDLQSGEVRWLGQADGSTQEHAARFSPDGHWLIVFRDRDSSLMPVLYDLQSGTARELRLPAGFSSFCAFVLDGEKLLVQLSSATRRSELLLYDLATDESRVVLPAEYGSIDATLFVPDEHITYPSSDGARVPALIYKPRAISAGDRLPAVIDVHGGPTGQWYRNFNESAQLLADRGFVVLAPNVRGSTGYGSAWRDAALKDWGGIDLEDVVAGAEYLRSLPYVDPERIGITGVSYGGYMTYIASVKKPDVFKVAAPIVGITDLLALYEENMVHFKYYLREQLGDPVVNEALYRDRSATTHAANLRAKMLILHGKNDPRCPLTQAELFRAKLEENGKVEGRDFEYHLFDDGHGMADVKGKTLTRQLLLDFLERNL